MLNLVGIVYLQALDTFKTSVISPVYYVTFTTLTILASMIMFKVLYHNKSISFIIHIWVTNGVGLIVVSLRLVCPLFD